MGYDNDIKWSSYMKRQCEFIWRMWLVGAWSANEDLGEQIEAEDIRSQSREWHVWGYTGPITYRKIERVPLLIQTRVQEPYQALLIALSINDFWAARRAAGAIYQAVQGYRKINFPRIYAPKWKKGAPSLEEIGLLVPKEIGAAERCITMFDKEYANEKTPHYGHVEPEQYKFFVHKASMRGNYVYVHPNEGDAIRLPRPMVHALPNHMLEGTGPGVPTEAPGPPAPGEGEEDEGVGPSPGEEPPQPDEQGHGDSGGIIINIGKLSKPVNPNQFGAKRLGVRYLDESGDPYTLGLGKHRLEPPAKVGDILRVGSPEMNDWNDYKETLPEKWDPWDKKMILKVWREDAPDRWAFAHWYELAYLRHRVEYIMDDPDQGGLLSNEQLREYAPQIVEWGERPIEEGAVGVEIDRDADKDNVTLLFDAMKNTHVKKLTLKADMRETRMMPFNFTRSNEYDELKPKRAIVSGKPPINFWSWDAMILDVGAILSNTMPEEMYRFNEYMRKKIEAEILAKFVRPREPSRKKRREGSYARKRGIKATDKKPLMAQSIASFGGLFWGTKHGYHREWQPPKKGRRFGKTGTMNIIWVKQERWSKYMDYFTWDFELYYRTYVTVMALVEQNAEQGNELNFDMVTGEFEIQNYLLGTVPNVNYIPLTWAGAFMGKDKSFKKGFNPYVDYLNGGIGFSNSAVGDFLTAAQKRGTVQEQERYYSVDTGLCPEHNDTLEYKGGQLWCPDGQHFPERVLRREKTPGLGYQLQQRREREPEAFIDRMYMMAPRSTGACPDVWLAFMALALDEESRSKDIRGTTIIIASMEYLEGITGGFHYLKQIDEWSDILLIDVGDQDYSLIFKWEPDMMRDVKWICNKPGCNYTQPYSPNDWADTGSQYPPVHHGVNMKPSGIPIVNYVYVGTDVDNLPYYVLRAVTGGMGGQQFEF